ncbi:hypothetical protein HFP15_01465 [Amycolatopsis sp. K13G38]|uniref:MmcQ/YjbR family DNA-binding protein n=1 Tax=Amycolatopsis acididurans TaxID=2724524 RepID=A0ABX1IVN4_9PSEU|nr:hypothetical protein [Amycolatopsis acididurans]NKQ51544.1 hypothetical protein [Amycolatopsis acididurans]
MKLLTADQALAGGSAGAARGWTAAEYRSVFGWDVGKSDGRIVLTLGRGVVALLVPVPVAMRVVPRLKRLDAVGPVFAEAGDEPHWVLLADANEFVTTAGDVPKGIVVLGAGQRIPVPCAETRASGPRWIVPPDPRRRWLPTLSTVLTAIWRV